ncbi:MAG: fimbrillin family protein [Alistipes sp.]|nr:fimbrillin family protein [Alistipes sp.]
MKRFFIVTLAVFVFTSCADEVLKRADESNVINLTASVANSTRVSTDIRNLQSFQLYGLHNGSELLMDKVVVSRDEANAATAWSYSPVTYWPRKGFINFFAAGDAIYGGGEHFASDFFFTHDKGAYITYAALDNDGDDLVKGVYDITYASNFDEATRNLPVQISFRHATSQLVFQFRNNIPNLQIYVEDIRIVNLRGAGCYTLPSSSTSKDNQSLEGSWNLDYFAGTEFDRLVSYDADINASSDNWIAIPNDGTIIRYPKVMASTEVSIGDKTIVEDGYVNILPQPINPWDSENDPTNQNNGSLFLLKIKIMDGETCIWPRLEEGQRGVDAGTDWVATPTRHAFIKEWHEGKRYIYTFIFNEGVGGLIPPQDNIEPGKPVLVPGVKIDKDISVQPWQ